VIMGRKTWQTMDKPLPGRTNIVITRDPAFHAAGATVVRSVEDGIRIARQLEPSDEETFIVGGAEIFRLALPLANRIDLTVIETNVEDGDAFFPEFEDDASWRLVLSEPHEADVRNAHAYTFHMYERVANA